MTNPRVLRLFPTPVVIDSVPDADELNAELEAAILARKESDPGVRASNVGGWHSERDLLSWTGEAGKRLVRHAIQLADAHTTDAQGRPVDFKWRIQAWANVSAAGHSNSPHVHGACYWSAVYYVRVGSGSAGNLLLHDPRMPGLRMHAPMLRLKGVGPELNAALKPAAGQMVLFPSWLSHSVQPWDGDEFRISIAINLSVSGEPRAP